MTTVYSVVGEHRDDPARLLALGSDGQHYVLTLPSGAAFPVEPGDDWEFGRDAARSGRHAVGASGTVRDDITARVIRAHAGTVDGQEVPAG